MHSLIPLEPMGMGMADASRAEYNFFLSFHALCTRLAGAETNDNKVASQQSLTGSATGSAGPRPLPLRHSRR